MNRKFTLGFLVILLVLLFTMQVSSQEYGCCYNNEDCYIQSLNCDGVTGGTFVAEDTYCESVDECNMVCCCDAGLSGSELIRTSVSCTAEGGTSHLYDSEWSTSSYLLSLSTLYSDENIEACMNVCELGLPPCTYMDCEAENTVDCACKDVESNATSGRYCCRDLGITYDTKTNCENACLAQSSVYGYVYEFTDTDTTPPLGSVTLKIGDVENITGTDGYYVLSNVQSSGSIIATKSGYLQKTVSYDVSQTDRYDIYLYPVGFENLACDTEGTTLPCDEIINNCNTQRTCRNGYYSECEIIPDTCLDIKVCGDGTVDRPNDYDGDGVFDESTDFYEECESLSDCGAGYTQCSNCLCVGPGECGDYTKNEGEECDPNPANWETDLASHCLPYATNCTEDCECVYEEAVCGDYILMPHAENCEFEDSTNSSTLPGSSCTANDCGKPGTPMECRCFYVPECGDGYIGASEECENSADCPNGNCVNCQCTGPCTDAPELNELETALPEVTISWNHLCTDNLFAYYVHRCQADDSNNCIADTEFVYGDVPLEPKEYTTTLPTDTLNYCFWIEAVYDLTDGPFVSTNYEKKCTSSGMAFCEDDYTTQFCYNNDALQCNNIETILLDDCGSSEVCVMDNNDNAVCVYQADCELCNGLFDMFYIEGYTYDENDELVSCEEVDACYLDYTNTTVDKYFSCYDVGSCYTYRSEHACTDDPCGVKNCEWASSLYYEDLGLGVCRSTREELQECDLCHDPDNFIFGECTKSSCELYGECYYDELGNQNNGGATLGCLAKNQLSCDYYDTQEECINYNGFNIESDTYVSWDDSYSSKIDGTNELLQTSDDYADLGLCKWIDITDTEQSCAKDADNNIINNTPLDDTGSAVGHRFDCEENDLKCQRDNSAPNTTLLYYGALPRNLDLDYVVHDDSYTKTDINTWFCVAPLGSFCYPDTATRYSNFLIREQMETGIYDLHYFSEDPSHNLEVLKKITITVDGELPLVLLKYELNSEEPDPTNNPGLFLTNLSVSFNVTNKMATCSADLVLDGESVRPSSNLNNVWGDTFYVQYNYLEDGDYDFIVVCEDSSGNTNSPNHYGIPINADTSITNPQPNSTFASGDDVAISVETAEEAECRYDYDESKPYGLMEGRFATTDGLTHTDEIDVTAEGIIILNVKCNFTSTGVIYGNKADRIKFAIDKEAPNTLIVDRFNMTIDESQLSGWKRFVNFSLLCSDPGIYENDNSYLKDWSFGCGHVYYDQSGVSPANTTSDRYNIYINNPRIYTLAYYSQDAGGNKGRTTYREVLVDNVEYGFDIVIKDFLTGSDEPVTILKADRPYLVEVTADKETSYDPDYKIDINNLKFRSGWNYLLVAEDQELTPPGTWTGYLVVQSENFPYYDNVQATFFIDTVDSHNIDSFKINSGETFYIDTVPPEQPKFDPEFDLYASLGYPAHKYNDTYYVSTSFLHVTANYSETRANVSFVVENVNKMTEPKRYYEVVYDQGDNGERLNEFSQTLEQAAEEGATEVFIEGYAGLEFETGNFVEFVGYAREDYMHYKELYEITDVEVLMAGDEISSTKLVINPALDRDMPLGTNINVYNSNHTGSWAGEYVWVFYKGENNISVEVTDVAGNTNKEEAVLYLDSVWPVAVESSLYPQEYFSTNNNRTNVSVIIREVGSGLDGDLTNFKIEGVDTNTSFDSFVSETYNCNYDLTRNENGAYICNKFTFVPSEDLDNSLYEATLTAYDLAHNLAYKTWYFYIEAGAPDMPEFKLKDALPVNPDPGNIWYINKTPEFTLDFSDPEPVTVYSTMLYNETGFISDTIIDCEKIGNFFDCSFLEELSEQEYSIEVLANKNLSDGKLSPTGRWTFWFTIDKTKPEFELYYDNITNPNIDIEFYGLVENEDGHNLLGYFFVNEEQEDMLYSYSPGELRIFTIPEEYDWALDEPVQDFNFTIRIMDYAGNYNEEDYGIRIDDEPPEVTLTDVVAERRYIKAYPLEFFRIETARQANVVLAVEYANVTGVIEEGYTGYDISEFQIISDIDIATSYVTLANVNEFSTLNLVGRKEGAFFEGDFKANLIIIGEEGEETLNNLNFIVKDQAQNYLDTYLGTLKDKKPPQLIRITVS